jgi:hypothetical protein
MRREEIKFLTADKTDSMAFHDFFAALIEAYPVRGYIHEPSFLVKICYRYLTLDRIICIHASEKVEGHLVCNKIEIAADFGGQCCGEEPLCHQPSLFVGLDVMNAFVSGKFAKQSDILFGKGAFPCDDVADVHR